MYHIVVGKLNMLVVGIRNQKLHIICYYNKLITKYIIFSKYVIRKCVFETGNNFITVKKREREKVWVSVFIINYDPAAC